LGTYSILSILGSVTKFCVGYCNGKIDSFFEDEKMESFVVVGHFEGRGFIRAILSGLVYKF